ncbi:uncharacterized protein CFAP97D1 [Apteryx rowi]|uniref:uncharacterized protein CFAP97D1 n=1 Tax=Apteryx rowi TaxID=308060 RepID=UPI000E1DAA43|nr:uncharacterized protein CFAP97D1 [Apteryx rowi]
MPQDIQQDSPSPLDSFNSCPTFDTKPCKNRSISLSLLYTKLEEDRLSGIERDNRLLLKKMSCIMRTKGQIDNKNDYKAKSLNREKRKKELLRVSQENRAILDRITKSEPQYQVQRWYEDWQQAEKYMANIARYPRGQCKAQSQKVNNQYLNKHVNHVLEFVRLQEDTT